jgi:hypothetical protein
MTVNAAGANVFGNIKGGKRDKNEAAEDYVGIAKKRKIFL